MKPARTNSENHNNANIKSPSKDSWWVSIRNRYIIILILFAVLPVITTSLVISVINSRSMRAGIYTPISVTATQKRSQLIAWANELEDNLAVQLGRDQAGYMAQLLVLPNSSESFRMIHDTQQTIFNSAIAAENIFEEIFLLNLDGDVIVSSKPDQEQTNYSEREFFIFGQEGPHRQNPDFELDNEYAAFIVAMPVISSQGETLGVLAGRANMQGLNSLMQADSGLGDTGETYLVSSSGELLTPTSSTAYQIGDIGISSPGIENSSKDTALGFGEYENYEGIPVIGAYHWIPELGASLIVEQQQDQAYSNLRTSRNLTVVVVLATLVFGAITAVLIGQSLAKPIVSISNDARRVAQGNLELQLDERDPGELGSLAQAFNSITSQLRNSFKLLEQRVEERTKQLRKRSEELVAAADVSRSVTMILETDILLKQVVDLIAQRFDLYYIGIFMADEQSEWAVLRAGTGKAGDEMVKRGHRLKIGEGSIVGWTIANSQARIALEAGEDPEHLATPDLPETRSEAALPLRSRGRIMGAMSIQSREPGAFDTDTIRVFQTMADQIAVAIDNANLFTELQETFEKSQTAYGQMSHKEWIKKLQSKPVGYRRDPRGVRQIQEKTPGKADENGDDRLTLPIVTRGRKIGYIEARKPIQLENKGKWRPEDIHFFEAIIDQLGVALESARLFEETQQQAEREHLIAEITSRMRATPDIEVVLQTAAREMRRALDLAEVEIRMGTPDQEQAPEMIEDPVQTDNPPVDAQESQDG